MTFSIVLATSGYELASSSSEDVFGPLHVLIAGQPFPATDWTDFAAPILGWWLEGVRTHFAEGRLETEVAFMDGPYALRIRTGPGGLELAGVRNGAVVASTQLSPAALTAEVEAAARRFLSAVALQGVDSKEVRVVRALLAGS